MSNSPESAARHVSTTSESSSGFKSFWKKSNKDPPPQSNLKIIEQDPITKRKTNRISRLLNRGSPASSQDDAEEGAAASAQKRRQQVYQAQKRHRNRKAEYVQELEAEVARLQHLDAIVNSEKNTIAYQNNAMRELLASHSLDAHLNSIDLSSISSSNDLSQLGSASVDTRFDPEMGHERTFLDLPDFSDMVWTSSENSTEGSQPARPAQHTPVAGDSWAALDFILALEWPCREHIAHHALNPNANVPEACKVGKFHGHALTATAAVFSSAQPPPNTSHERSALLSDKIPNQKGLQPNSAEHWQLPHSEIDKLVELSELLKLDDESMTPAQAYTAVRETVPSDKFLRPTLDALKKPLGSLVQCHGFGACMDAPAFWQYLDGTIQSLQFTRPELSQ